MSTAKRRKITSDGPPLSVIKSKSNQLYDTCIETREVGEEWSIADMLELKVTSDADELRDLCQELLDCHLLVPYSRRTNTVYRTRSKEEALKSVSPSSPSFLDSLFSD
jgi:hypothetical protein